MKKGKFLIMMAVLTVIFGFTHSGTTANAMMEIPENVEVTTVEVNELDYLNALLNATDTELRARGMTEEEIRELRTYDYNADLMRLTNADVNTLKNMGYSRKQIGKIKAYDGQTDAVSYASTYGLSNAVLSGYHYATPVEEWYSMKIVYGFGWSEAPMFCIADSIVLAWIGCNEESEPIVLEVLEEGHEVAYFSVVTNLPTVTDEVSASEKNVSSRVIEFGLGRAGVEKSYARIIDGYIIVKTLADSYNFSNIYVAAAYGHTVFGVVPAGVCISIEDVSISLEVAWNQQTLYSECEAYPTHYEIR